ncbi:MAG: M15 family metallopeptidase [Verrucomicrobiota bacterium]
MRLFDIFLLITLLNTLFLTLEAPSASKRPSDTPHADLIDVSGILPTVIIDMRYATPHNFVGRVLYKDKRAFLRKETIEALKVVVAELENQGFRLVILDAYRPPSVQRILYNSTDLKEFVAPPIPKYNRHGRGTAVDVTLADMKGNLVEMPSEFDEFTERADQDFSDVSPIAGKHGRILISAFHKAGFSGLRKEWWHFDLRNWRKFDVIED